MSNAIEKTNLICVEQVGGENHNKFWSATVMDDNSVLVEWGRVGKTAQSQIKTFSSVDSARSFVHKKRNEKEKKGYEEIEIVSDVPVSTKSVKSVNSIELKNVAKTQIKHTNKNVANLIDYLTQVNAHTIMEATKGAIRYNSATGLYTTALGCVGQSSIDAANDLLVKIGDLVAKNKQKSVEVARLSQQYLRYIPTDIGMRKFNPELFWNSLNEVQAQKQIVDALQASLISVTTMPQDTKDSNVATPQVFDVQLELIDDKKQIKNIEEFYKKSKGSHYDVKDYKVKTIYSVNIASERKAFENYGAKMSNIWTLFHGTSSSNVLSILKQGLVIPPASSSHCTGRLFSDGVYASDQSTKALRYATGAWGQKASSRTFMFIIDMAMGKYYIPSSSNYTSIRYPVKGYDSTFAKAGHSGVMNNEMIVYRTDQVQLKYLVEFEK
jgi:poly [ADP-ribose] polymerase 2/3/4